MWGGGVVADARARTTMWALWPHLTLSSLHMLTEVRNTSLLLLVGVFGRPRQYRAEREHRRQTTGHPRDAFDERHGAHPPRACGCGGERQSPRERRGVLASIGRRAVELEVELSIGREARRDGVLPHWRGAGLCVGAGAAVRIGR